MTLRPRLSATPLPAARGYARRAADRSGYVTPCGKLPSVTRIIGVTSEGRDRLEAWKKSARSAGVGETAARRGTWCHTQIERWIRGEPPQRSFPFGAYWRNVQPWLEAHLTEAVAIEAAVWHPSGFSGTFDFLGTFAWGESDHSALTIGDWKTSAKYKDPDGPMAYILDDYFAQLGAYRAAIRHTYDLNAERGVLVIARPHTHGPDVYELTPPELDAAESAFMKRLDAYYAMPDNAAAPFSVQ